VIPRAGNTSCAQEKEINVHERLFFLRNRRDSRVFTGNLLKVTKKVTGNHRVYKSLQEEGKPEFMRQKEKQRKLKQLQKVL
jgi:hypothetical protein